MLDLTLAQLALTPPGGNIEAAKPYLRKLHAGTKIKHSVPLTLLSMDYKVPHGTGKHTLLVPVPLTDDADFSMLAIVLKHLSGVPYVLQDLHAHAVTLAPPPHVRFSWHDAALLHHQLARRQKHIIAGAKALPPFTDAKLQLQLTQFFIDQHVRDAAYLAMENTKNALAQATTQQSADPADIAALSKEADVVENDLHEKMPYSL